MTVSNVVNGRFKMMSAGTRKRVEDAIARLNYRPYSAGRSLRLDERLTIGILIVDESPTYLADPFTTNLVAGLSNFLSKRGYGLLVQGTPPQALRDAIFLRRFDTDGLCVLLSGAADSCKEHIARLVTLGQPLVVLESKAPRQPAEDICFIRQDNFGGARHLAQHLVSLGARRFVYLAPKPSWPAIAERQRGIESVLRQMTRASLNVVHCGENFHDVRAALSTYLDDGTLPDAVLGGNDQMGIAAMRLLIDRGHRIPDDVMVAGFNAFEFRLYTDPVLTSVASAAYDIGARAGTELLHRLTNGRFTASEILLPTTFVPGGSTADIRARRTRRARKAYAS
jgi:LacI family transcriptional regulator